MCAQTKKTFIQVLRKWLEAVTEVGRPPEFAATNPMMYSGHSFRRGGLQWLHSQDPDLTKLAAHAGWSHEYAISSTIMLRYVHLCLLQH